MKRHNLAVGALIGSLLFCSCTDAERFIGNAGYDHLSQEEQIVYEELYSNISNRVYEAVLKAGSGMDLYNAYAALEEDFGSELEFPVDVMILETKEGSGGRVNYTLRYIFSNDSNGSS